MKKLLKKENIILICIKGLSNTPGYILITTRWSSQHDTIRAIHESFAEITKTLEDSIENPKLDANDRALADGLLRKMTSARFTF